MVANTHPSNIKACNIILVTACLGIINYLLIGPFTTIAIISMLFAIGIIVILAILARKGYNWFKWVYLVLFAIGLPSVIENLSFTIKPYCRLHISFT